MITTALIVLSYLAGSIPFGVLVARAKGIDIRQVGSGNIGATNVGRILGRRYGWLVFALDFLKGFGPVLAARLLGPRLDSTPFGKSDLPVLCAAAAVIGHVSSIWLRFRGGKGGATGLGVGAALVWPAMLAAGAVWLAVVAVTRYVSLGTILGSIAYLAAYLVMAFLEGEPFDRERCTLTIFCIAVTALVIYRHKDNIKRLMSGTENKV
ncbi:MAG: glycerol-3-phosphate 1-O-acyltransferase PlsY [Planctomycetes bacterium]|nr:glycerol-3-phosphate 1-O-acyltransferase PlsY [Planctomycetota bacterium]